MSHVSRRAPKGTVRGTPRQPETVPAQMLFAATLGCRDFLDLAGVASQGKRFHHQANSDISKWQE